MGKPKDITNQRVGSLIAIEISYDKIKDYRWNVKYDNLEEKYQKEYSYENSMEATINA